jgi:elongation factor P hydroxylase
MCLTMSATQLIASSMNAYNCMKDSYFFSSFFIVTCTYTLHEISKWCIHGKEEPQWTRLFLSLTLYVCVGYKL